MSLRTLFSRNPIKKMSREELKELETRLNIRSERLTKEVAALDREIEYLFQKTKEARSHLEEINLANRIKTLSQKKEMKVAVHADQEKELRAVTNLLIIKEHEADLKAVKVWEPLQKLSPEYLQKYLIDIKLESQDRESAVKTIIDITSSALKPSIEYEEGLEEILSMVREVKEGKLEPHAAAKMMSEKKEEE